MKTSLDCIPCFVRQALEAITLVSPKAGERQRLMRYALRWISDMKMGHSPPAVAQEFHRKLRERMKVKDPYRKAKDQHNSLAKALIPALRRHIEDSPDQLAMAVRFAITGNIIDLGAKNGVGFGDILAEMQSAPMQPIFGNMDFFKKSVKEAKNILYLADNAGEIFFDRLLIEQLNRPNITVAVRGAPVINDATVRDARAAGLEEIAEVIDNGSDAPGTLLDDCSRDFRHRFKAADVIIAKGQGNFETLKGVADNIFFLFRIKCPIISIHCGFDVGTYVAANRFSLGVRI